MCAVCVRKRRIMNTKPVKSALGRKVNFQYTAVQSAYWMSFLPIGSFAVVLLQSKNFTDSEIGILLAIQSFASIVAQPAIAAFAGKHTRIPLKRIVAALLVVSALIFSFMYFIPHLFVPALLIFAVMGATTSSVPAFVNAIAMQLNNAGIPVNYGIARGMGSMSFAVVGIILGKLIDMSGVDVIIPFYAAASMVTVAFLLTMHTPPVPKASGDDKPKAPKTNLIAFLAENKSYAGFCIASALLFSSHAFINTFLPNIVQNLGGSVTDMGITRSIAAACELPVMFIFSFLTRKFGSRSLLVVSGFSFFAKTLLTLFAPGMAFLFVLQFLQMPAFGLYTPAAVQFSDQSVSDENRVRAQAISAVSGFGIGNVIGNLCGGFLLDIFGLLPMLIFASVIAFLGFAVMLVSMRGKKAAGY